MEGEKSLKEIDIEAGERKIKAHIAEANETKAAAQKIDADPNLRYTHPLMNCEMNLMEVSNRTVEKIERAKYRIVGKSTGDLDADKQAFLDCISKELVKWN